ncbi:MAG TPA: hypothetical protein VE870_06655 [Bacteroidales bacterium]|nr:hypothetical protein [Bacteroidales bacterium]
MKTTTKNNGNRLHKIIFVLAAGLITMNLLAQKSIRTYEIQKFTNNLFKSTEQIMLAFANNTSDELAFDEDIELEDWMTDLTKWVTTIDSGLNMKESILSETKKVIEEEMVFEDWMFQTDWLNDENSSAIDEDLVLENWMMSPFNQNEYYSDNTSGRK